MKGWRLGAAAAVALASVLVCVLATVLAFTLPGGLSPDEPEDKAVAAAPGGLSYAELERQTQRRPRDGRAWVLKARLDTEAGRYELAAAGYAQALAVGRNVARDPGVWIEYAEAKGLAQDGRLAGEPLRGVQQALAIDPHHAQALDLAGSAAWEAGDYATAVRHWRHLQTQLPPADERHAALSRALEKAEQQARVSLPPRP